MNLFDIEWIVTDPREKQVVMCKSIKDARSAKHADPPEYLSTDKVREIIRHPDRIDASSQRENCDIYYCVSETETYRFARAVVDFGLDPDRGIVRSWSRYEHPVSSHGVIYRKGENDEDRHS